MSRDEIKKLIGGIIIAYPNYKPTDMQMTVSLWEDMLKDFTYKQAMLSLKAYIATDRTGFAPSIGAIIQGMPKSDTEEDMNELEAWALVSKALRNGYYGAEAEFEKLPELVKKAVGNPSNLRNWSQTSIESIENVVQSNFIKTYRTIQKREKEFQALPPSVRLEMQGERKRSIEQHDNDRQGDLLRLSDS